MTNVAKLRPYFSNLEMKNESYVRMYDMVFATKEFYGFYRSGNKQYAEGLTAQQLGDILNSILEKKPMDTTLELNKLIGSMSQDDFDLIITAYLSQGRLDFALDLIRDVNKYLIHKNKGDKSPQQLASDTLTRLYDPINYSDRNLFDIASVVLKGDQNDEFYQEMRNLINKWPPDYNTAVKKQIDYLNTKLGKKK